MDRATAILSLGNAAKALPIAARLLALAASIVLIAPWLAHAPIETYQLPMLAAATWPTLRLDLVWRAQAPHIATFALFSTYIFLLRMLLTHPVCLAWLKHLDEAGWPTSTLLTAASLALFATAADMHESQILAAAAVGCFTWLLAAAAAELIKGLLWLSVANYGGAVAASATIEAWGRHPALAYGCTNAVALRAENYCTAAVAMVLWFGILDESIGKALMFTAVLVAVGDAACVVYFRLVVRTSTSIFACAAVAVLLGWVTRLMDTLGAVITLMLCGAVLFGSGLLLDRHRRLLVFKAPQRREAPGAGSGNPDADSVMLMPPLSEGSTGRSSDAVPLLDAQEAC